jgi:superfamily II DNA helicase RecQ
VLSDQNLPGEREQLLTVLRCISTAPWSWGRRSLTRILRGEAGARPGGQPLHERACESEAFGALAFRSGAAVERLLDRLEEGGFLQARNLEHGGVVLDITAAGKAALQEPSALDGLVEPAKKPQSPPTPSRRLSEEAAGDSEIELDVDDALFEKLRTWRLEQAHAQDVPPYIVFHDSHLRAIAAQHPLTLDALSGVKGVGPRKLERYGEAVIGLVNEHLKGDLRTKEEKR